MTPIPSLSALHAGDILHHPAFGFATIDQVGPQDVDLRWERPGPTHPVTVSETGLKDAYRRCDPRGLLARSVASLDATRTLLAREPIIALTLLLLDLGGRQRVQDLRDWLGERRLVSDARFDDWWAAVVALLATEDNIVVRRQQVTLVEGLGFEQVTPQAHSPLPAPGSLAASAAPAFAARFARALAEIHARGHSLAGGRDAVRLGVGGFELKTRPRQHPREAREDVRVVARLILEQVFGVLPDAAVLPEEELAALLPVLEPGLSFDLLGALSRALATPPSLRPEDGLAFFEDVAAAVAGQELRAAMPHAPGAAIVVGFDTHIGLAKSLERQTNQDAYVLLGDPELALVGVADGISLSSAGSGDLASFLFSRSLRAWWQEHRSALQGATPARVHALLYEALRQANKLVCEQALKLAGGDLRRHIPMGTTTVLALTAGNRIHLACLGDSRGWVVGRHGVSIVSTDMNLQSLRLREALAGGEVEWEEPGHSLTSYIGHFTIEGRSEMPPVFTRTFHLLPGEWLILATDGLSDFAAPTESQVSDLLARLTRDPEGDPIGAPVSANRAMEVARKLVAAANRGGGGDNVTVLALTLSAEEPPANAGEAVP